MVKIDSFKSGAATPKQIAYIKSLGHSGDIPNDKAEVSALIDKLLGKKPNIIPTKGTDKTEYVIYNKAQQEEIKRAARQCFEFRSLVESQAPSGMNPAALGQVINLVAGLKLE